jgi:hypothetical protein
MQPRPMLLGVNNNAGAARTRLEMAGPAGSRLPSLEVWNNGPFWAMYVAAVESGVLSYGREIGVWGRSGAWYDNRPTAGVAGDLPASVATDGTRSDFPPGVWGAGPIGVLGSCLPNPDDPHLVVREGCAGVVGRGEAPSSHGVIGEANSGGHAGVLGRNEKPGGYAGWFHGYTAVNGDLVVTGNLTKGGGGFKIDHPLDPENKYLSHSFVEAPDALNVYSGNATTDADGNATVTLPEYFEALNHDFRYQLTVIGDLAHAVVAEEISDNQFRIKTDRPDVKVSWQVTGVRRDALANLHPIPVEEEKPAEEQGTYLHPEAFEQPKSRGAGYAQREALAEALRARPEMVEPEAPDDST